MVYENGSNFFVPCIIHGDMFQLIKTVFENNENTVHCAVSN